jgi:hypothetical protein
MNTCAGTSPVPPGVQGAARAVEPSPECPTAAHRVRGCKLDCGRQYGRVTLYSIRRHDRSRKNASYELVNNGIRKRIHLAMQGKGPEVFMGIAALLENPPNQSSSAPISRLPGSSFYWCIWKLSTAEQIGCDPSNRLRVGHLHESGVHQQVRPGIGTFWSGFRCSED